MPKPPTAARPRKLSVTEIETWLRDPYAIYAKHVLKLKPLDPLDAPIGPLERGTGAASGAGIVQATASGRPPDDAVAQLMAIADQVFEELPIPKATLSVWRPRFRERGALVRGIRARARAAASRNRMLEIRGERDIADAPGGDFTLRGVADRIDILQRWQCRHSGLQDRRAAQQATGDANCWRRNCRWKARSWPKAGFPALGKRDSGRTALSAHLRRRGEAAAYSPSPMCPL